MTYVYSQKCEMSHVWLAGSLERRKAGNLGCGSVCGNASENLLHNELVSRARFASACLGSSRPHRLSRQSRRVSGSGVERDYHPDTEICHGCRDLRSHVDDAPLTLLELERVADAPFDLACFEPAQPYAVLVDEQVAEEVQPSGLYPRATVSGLRLFIRRGGTARVDVDEGTR